MRLSWIFCLVLAGSGHASAQHIMHPDSVLEGVIGPGDLAANYPWFTERMEAYKPSQKIIKALQPYTDKLAFSVVMGTWCSDSREHVPPFFRVMQALHFDESRVRMIAVDRKKRTTYADVDALQIAYVPTIIVLYNGREVGRIVEDTKKSIEKDLLDILQQAETNNK